MTHAQAARDGAPDRLYLGIDTGGTYTDAVLYSEDSGIIAKAKALTTRHDLAAGTTDAARRVIAAAGIDAASIRLVSISTTLATNALVEEQGGRACLVMIGFEPADLERDGLARALGDDPVIFCPGGHDVHGQPRALDLSPLEQALDRLEGEVTGFAVAAYFAVRNPEHELAARALITKRSAHPVTCSHELSTRLGGPRRALTTLLNARLIPLITRLIESTGQFMDRHGIDAPLMVVRGDGALITSTLARQRPIETILSGAAASIVGARLLTGLDDAVVSDIGGTTTDIAVLEGGRPRLDQEGATVGRFRTMVEAVAIRTYGLGGDSEVLLDEDGLDPAITLSPRRLVPLSLAAAMHGHAVVSALQRQLDEERPGRHDGRLAMRVGVPERFAIGLSAAEGRLYEAIGATPVALDEVLTSNLQIPALARLVRRGLVHICGFTPSDAAHVLGRQDNWDRAAARLGADLLLRRRNSRGGAPIGVEELCRRVLVAVERRSAEVMIESALCEDGLEGETLVRSPLVQRALDGEAGIGVVRIGLDRPLVGLGASAPLHYAGLGERLGTQCFIPADGDVANALGAVAGQVRASAEALVSRVAESLYRVSAGAEIRDFAALEEALAHAEHAARGLAEERARLAGTDFPVLSVMRERKSARIEGEEMFIEERVVATAAGRPRITAPAQRG